MPTQIWYADLSTWECICLYSYSSCKTQLFHADFQKLVHAALLAVSAAADLFFPHNNFALLISCSGELSFCWSVPLTADQAELIISCLCHGVIFVHPSLLQNSSHHSVANWLCVYPPPQTGSFFRTKTTSQPSLLAQFLVNRWLFVKQNSFGCVLASSPGLWS